MIIEVKKSNPLRISYSRDLAGNLAYMFKLENSSGYSNHGKLVILTTTGWTVLAHGGVYDINHSYNYEFELLPKGSVVTLTT